MTREEAAEIILQNEPWSVVCSKCGGYGTVKRQLDVHGSRPIYHLGCSACLTYGRTLSEEYKAACTQLGLPLPMRQLPTPKFLMDYVVGEENWNE